MLALLLVVVMAGLASAAPAPDRGHRIVLTGSEERFFGVPGRAWVADGKTEIRDLPLTGHFAFSGDGMTFAGTETQMTNATLDGINGITWGTVTYTDAATGFQCAGAVFGTITNGLGTLTVLAGCSNGGLLKGTLYDRETMPAGQAPPDSVRSDFEGVLLSAD